VDGCVVGLLGATTVTGGLLGGVWGAVLGALLPLLLLALLPLPLTAFPPAVLSLPLLLVVLLSALPLLAFVLCAVALTNDASPLVMGALLCATCMAAGGAAGVALTGSPATFARLAPARKPAPAAVAIAGVPLAALVAGGAEPAGPDAAVEAEPLPDTDAFEAAPAPPITTTGAENMIAHVRTSIAPVGGRSCRR
jgi:hypothetical protein